MPVLRAKQGQDPRPKGVSGIVREGAGSYKAFSCAVSPLSALPLLRALSPLIPRPEDFDNNTLQRSHMHFLLLTFWIHWCVFKKCTMAWEVSVLVPRFEVLVTAETFVTLFGLILLHDVYF